MEVIARLQDRPFCASITCITVVCGPAWPGNGVKFARLARRCGRGPLPRRGGVCGRRTGRLPLSLARARGWARSAGAKRPSRMRAAGRDEACGAGLAGRPVTGVERRQCSTCRRWGGCGRRSSRACCSPWTRTAPRHDAGLLPVPAPRPVGRPAASV